MGKHNKQEDLQQKADEFDQSVTDAQERVAAKGGVPAALPPKKSLFGTPKTDKPAKWGKKS